MIDDVTLSSAHEVLVTEVVARADTLLGAPEVDADVPHLNIRTFAEAAAALWAGWTFVQARNQRVEHPSTDPHYQHYATALLRHDATGTYVVLDAMIEFGFIGTTQPHLRWESSDSTGRLWTIAHTVTEPGRLKMASNLRDLAAAVSADIHELDADRQYRPWLRAGRFGLLLLGLDADNLPESLGAARSGLAAEIGAMHTLAALGGLNSLCAGVATLRDFTRSVPCP